MGGIEILPQPSLRGCLLRTSPREVVGIERSWLLLSLCSTPSVVVEAFLAGSVESVSACLADRVAATLVFVVRCRPPV